MRGMINVHDKKTFKKWQKIIYKMYKILKNTSKIKKTKKTHVLNHTQQVSIPLNQPTLGVSKKMIKDKGKLDQKSWKTMKMVL